MKKVVLLMVVFLMCCGGHDAPTSTPERAFLFAMRGIPDAEGQFVAVTSEPGTLAALERQLALPEDQRMLHINGPIAPGNGGHNLGWSWHFQPDRWELAEISIELCDGRPQHVEDDVNRWIADVGRFCPWASFVRREL